MSDYEISEALQLRQQRFDAALAFTIVCCDKDGLVSDLDIIMAIKMADNMIAKLEAPTIVDEDTAF